MSDQAAGATETAPSLPAMSGDSLVYSQKRDRILALWNTGDYSMAEIGDVIGMRPGTVSSLLHRARLAGLEVLTITPSEKGRRAARSLRLWRGQAETGVITPEASVQLRTAWLSGVSAVRIAVMLDTTDRLVRIEARRLGLPRRKTGPRQLDRVAFPR